MMPAGYRKFLADPDRVGGVSTILSQLGGGLLSANAPSLDPGNYGRQLGRAVQGVGPAVQQGQAARDRGRLTTQAIEEAERERSERERQRQAYEGLIGGAPTTAPQALAQGGGPTPEAAGLLGTPQPGLLNNLTPDQRGILGALGPEQGARVLAQQAFPKQGKRQYLKAADGFYYDPQTGKRVFPDVEKAPRPDADDRTYRFLAQDKEGNTLPVVDDGRGNFSVMTPSGPVPYSPEQFPDVFTASQAGDPKAERLPASGMDKLRTERNTAVRGLRSLDRLAKLVEAGPEGWANVRNRIAVSMKRAFGNTDLTDEQLAQRLREGELSRVAGSMRIELFGGGPLTDSERAVAQEIVLGGDVWFKEEARQRLRSLYGDKVAAVNDLEDRLEYQMGLRGGKFGRTDFSKYALDKVEPLVPDVGEPLGVQPPVTSQPSATPPIAAPLSAEEQAELEELRKRFGR